jgi:hypothetical protein
MWIILGTCTPHAGAQYFGRNKIQYEEFDFRVLQTPHFEIYFYPRESEVTEDAAKMLERWYDRFSELFGHTLKHAQPIIVYANHADFQQTNAIGGLIPQGTGGVTEGLMNRIVLPFTGVYRDNDHVLGHELVHAFQYDIMRSVRARFSVSGSLPLWFVEGMCEYLSLGREDPLTAMWMRDAVLHEDVPTIGEIALYPRYFPYRYGHAIWAYIAGTWEDEIVPRLYRAVLERGWEKGCWSVLGIPSDMLSGAWRKALQKVYQLLLEGRTGPGEAGVPIIAGEGA